MANNYTPAPAPWQQFFDPTTGAPLNGGLLYIDQAGLSGTAATTYQTSNGTASAYPIVLDASGRAAVFLAPGSYLFRVYRADGSLVRTQDNISAVPFSAINTDVTGTMGVAGIAGNVVYLSDGSGALTAGRWYLADSANAYSSINPEIGILPNDIASGISGTIRKIGSITVPTVTAGTSYYVGTAGALTSTAPFNKRYVGVSDTVSTLVLDPSDPVIPVNQGMCQGRLTLTTATPVTIADVTAAGTLYFTPYQGNLIGLYDGTATWVLRAFAELSIAVPALTAQMYDVFVYDASGTATLELLAWTNDTTRATALVLQNGVLVKTGATTRRYVGSFRTTGVANQTEDSKTKRYVFNYYNRVRRELFKAEATASWTYVTAAWRQANAAAANQVEVVIGVAEVLCHLAVSVQVSIGTITSYVGIGEDSVTVLLASDLMLLPGNAAQPQPLGAVMDRYPAIGRHYYAWLEYAGGATTTFYSAVGGIAVGGLSGWTEG